MVGHHTLSKKCVLMNNRAVEGAADEGAGGSPERASGGGADVPASPASPASPLLTASPSTPASPAPDALEEAWNA